MPFINLEIDENSPVPKYQQVVDYMVFNICEGKVQMGEKIPSINETSEECFLSRDTVEKAYKFLRSRGFIRGVKGKGYYVTNAAKVEDHRILLVFNKLSDHKKAIFNAFIKNLNRTATVDLQIHNCDEKTLVKIISENFGRYDYYVIMPHLFAETESVRTALNRIPKEKLLLINKDIPGISGNYGCVYEDFAGDIKHMLNECLDEINKYRKLYLVFPTENYYCQGIREGFVNFCRANHLPFEIIDQAKRHEIKPYELFIVIEEADLVELVKKASGSNLKLGKKVGIIAYNDSPFKEILAGGITTLSTDFERMGEETARMIRAGSNQKIKNPFKLIRRNSL